ncbi:hypothetical protein F4802DRAFT_461804 [Xylaria palmicola]|nr:hypothetical protein F4802DRAFT_461804 [Xylaria palmicola]
MASSFAELIHAAPDHGSSPSEVAATGVGDLGDGSGARDSGLASGDGPEPSAPATAGTAALTTRPGSGPCHPVPAPMPAPAPAPAPVAPAAAPSRSLSPPIPPEIHYPISPTSTSPPSSHRVLHAHRQSHNSSKLPAFRFTDRNKESLAQASLLQRHIPPSPVSPDSDQRPETLPNTTAPKPETTQNHSTAHDIVSTTPSSGHSDPARSRASTFQLSAPLPATTSSAHLKRSISLDTTSAAPNTAGVRSPSGSTETIVTVLQRRAPPTSTNSPQGQGTDAASGGLPAEATRDGHPGQRELLLSKTLQRSASDDRRASLSRKPPVSFRPRTNTSGSGITASIPPIRSFRSSGQRRSLVLDMNHRSARSFDRGDEYGDSNDPDRTLRALDIRGEEYMQWTPPDSAGERPDGDDSGDPFLKIAREDSSQRPVDGSRTYAENNAISRVARNARRPLSLAVSSYRSPSPPRISRRLSEHESRFRGQGPEQGERTGPPVSYRGHSREPHSEDYKLRGSTTPIRASPLTPRTLTYQDSSEANSAHKRRRSSIDRGSTAVSRLASLKQANVNYSHPRAYGSSPLIPHAADAQKYDTPPNKPVSVDGTDSTNSTAAPSTVWDELEELKSRIHRLELTGKVPPTSSAAISGASEDRPPTAHTNATTLSTSPKRGASNGVQSTEAAAQPKDTHPLLHSALAKSKDFLAHEVYDALETATIDALALVAMMGTAGQPGPISSGASNIGSSSGSVTDRQLRKKADSVCRSLTELCLALNENAVTPQQVPPPSSDDNTVTSPTVIQFTGIAPPRRPSVPINRVADLAASPRAVSRYEEKRATVLAASALPSPRYSGNLPTMDGAVAGRKSSLLFSRTRRAGTEEPEDGRRTSVIIRNRRAGTEEPEDASDRALMLKRGRRATLDNSEDDSRFRTSSRAVTEVNGTRQREYVSQLPPPPPIPKEIDTLANSALPRRRLATTTLNTRLAQPPATTATTASAIVTPSRRYFDRTVLSRETPPEADKAAEDRPQQRQFSLSRSGSLNRRVMNRQSMIATPSTTTAGYYR